MIASPAQFFELPKELEASSPPEARGLSRDEVRMMVSHYSNDEIVHTTFREFPYLLEAGDVVVINTSGTLNAALDGVRANGESVEVHLSTQIDRDLWTIELRRPSLRGSTPMSDGHACETIELADGAQLRLLAPQRRTNNASSLSNVTARDDATSIGSVAASAKGHADGVRLWRARLDLHEPLDSYLERHGRPIRYGYVNQPWPIEYYQNVYATEPGSAEMPSAGRPFTTETITRLVARGILVVPLILHTGVASLESHEAPYEEFFRIPATTAHVVNAAHANSRRIVAVGTTVVRALETAADESGLVTAREGWTDLVISPSRKPRTVNALLTGMHEPKATHLAMIEALAGRAHVQMAYHEAVNERYLWHEFGDVHLILP
ncbi:MAG: S-adenosylmethionine:tRNA ribosyltransferase-isomerase [bacterium]|nr:S-adenosylmethionine:tRNA ribosyltransferase-isomerase [Candidatus Kapabacteria bacterium]